MLIQKAMIKTMSDSSNVDVDVESYEEVKSISMELSDELINPEE